MSSPKLVAWGDESIRLGADPPSYLLGAAIAPAEACDEIRAQLLPLKGKSNKLHWHSLGDSGRAHALDLIASFDVVHVIIVGTPVEPKREERARALCLQRLAWELDDAGVSALTLEARPQSLMARDIRTVNALRGQQALPKGLRVDHALPSNEPMLWIADQVLGALGESFVRGDAYWFDKVRRSTRIERIQV